MTETNEVAVSHAPRHSNFFPSPESVERSRQKHYREARSAREAQLKAPRAAMRARVENWAIWKSGERRTIKRLTGQLTHNIVSTDDDADNEMRIANDADAALLDKSIERLPVQLYMIINYKFLQDQENQWIADKLHFSKRTVNNRIDGALDMLGELTA